jgi:hypothetical protein
MVESFSNEGLKIFLVLTFSVFLLSVVLALDSDDDGFASEYSKGGLRDCNDDDYLINPSAIEVFDGIDNNCDGEIDEGKTTYYFDSDQDGYGKESIRVVECFGFENYTEVFGDCNDEDVEINPGVLDVCDNGVDEDCDGHDLVCGEDVLDINIGFKEELEIVVLDEQSSSGAGLGAVVGVGTSSLILLLVFLVIVGGLVIIVMMRKEKKSSSSKNFIIDN